MLTIFGEMESVSGSHGVGVSEGVQFDSSSDNSWGESDMEGLDFSLFEPQSPRERGSSHSGNNDLVIPGSYCSETRVHAGSLYLLTIGNPSNHGESDFTESYIYYPIRSYVHSLLPVRPIVRTVSIYSVFPDDGQSLIHSFRISSLL